jgi:serine/threonine-protein kinase RsbW
MDESVAGVVELRIPCRAEWVAVARLAVAGVANRLRFSVEEIEDVKLAVAEACTNCILHPNASDQIEVTCETHEDALTVHVRNFGTHSTAAGTRAPVAAEPQVGALGVFLIRSLMDSVEYGAAPGSGTNLVMTKKVSS